MSNVPRGSVVSLIQGYYIFPPATIRWRMKTKQNKTKRARGTGAHDNNDTLVYDMMEVRGAFWLNRTSERKCST